MNTIKYFKNFIIRILVRKFVYINRSNLVTLIIINMEKSYKIASYLLILLGVIHSGFTPFFYKTLSADSLWFFGTGLTYLFMGLYNLASIKVKIKSISRIAVILNFIGTIFTMAITYILKEPQSYFALILVIMIFIFSILSTIGFIKN